MSQVIDEMPYQSHEQLAHACSEAFQEILRKSYKEDVINTATSIKNYTTKESSPHAKLKEAIDAIESDCNGAPSRVVTNPEDVVEDGIKILYQINQQQRNCDCSPNNSASSITNEQVNSKPSPAIEISPDGEQEQPVENADESDALEAQNPPQQDRRRNRRVRVNPIPTIYELNNRYEDFHLRPLEIPFFGHIPEHIQVILNYLYGQGDTQDIDNVGRLGYRDETDRRDNIVVSVLFSPYAKLMAFILALNTLFLFKLAMWSCIKDYFRN